MTVLSVLQNMFGHKAFRGPQEAVIETVLRGENALLLMPTGLGKSVCYQIPAYMYRGQGLVLVISPLIALMKDQVDSSRQVGLQVAALHSAMTRSEREQILARLQAGELELLYVTPERFRKSEFRQALARQKVRLLAIDEAHCISSWGHDFRPDYTRLKDIRESLGNPPTLALTATATPVVQKDILQQLGLTPESCQVFNEGVRRPGLALRVQPVHGLDDKVRAIVAYRHLQPGPAIVYFSLIQTLQGVAHELQKLGLVFDVYHGQLPARERRRAQESFLRSPDGLILATPAFGLGVNKENVRMVLHAEVPGSLEAYYQEVGRAGRDAQAATCVLLYDGDDVSIQMDFLKWANPDPGFIQTVYNLIARNPDRVRAEGYDYLRAQLNFYNSRDFRLETAVNLLERWGSLEGEDPRAWRAIEDPPGEYLQKDLYEARFKAQQSKLWEMVQWVKSDDCRMQIIHRYFGEVLESPCGMCDICRGEKPEL